MADKATADKATADKAAEGVALRRCQPWLGTLVEITAQANAQVNAQIISTHAAITQAFAVIASEHARFTRFDTRSELSQINQNALNATVVISPEMHAVLSAAVNIATLSQGAFDPTSGAQAFDAIQLGSESVRFLRPLQLDLNGIAKGFAVDLAINTLQSLGCVAGVVNAGGDLRCFGSPIQLHLRCPRTGGLLNESFTLRNAACASSGGRLHWRKSAKDRALRPTLMGKHGRMRQLRSMTVVCSDAMTADALTKVALFAGIKAADVLAQFGAQAHELRA